MSKPEQKKRPSASQPTCPVVGFSAVDAQPASLGYDPGVLLTGVVVAVLDLAAAAATLARRFALGDPARQRNVHGRIFIHPLPEEPRNGVVRVPVQLQHGDVGPVRSVAEPILMQVSIDDVENLHDRSDLCVRGRIRRKRLTCSSTGALATGLLQ